MTIILVPSARPGPIMPTLTEKNNYHTKSIGCKHMYFSSKNQFVIKYWTFFYCFVSYLCWFIVNEKMVQRNLNWIKSACRGTIVHNVAIKYCGALHAKMLISQKVSSRRQQKGCELKQTRRETSELWWWAARRLLTSSDNSLHRLIQLWQNVFLLTPPPTYTIHHHLLHQSLKLYIS